MQRAFFLKDPVSDLLWFTPGNNAEDQFYWSKKMKLHGPSFWNNVSEMTLVMNKLGWKHLNWFTYEITN